MTMAFEESKSKPKGVGESQRDSIIQPRVATKELPWEAAPGNQQPQRGCIAFVGDDATPLGLKSFATLLPRVARSSQP